ncbi:cyclohexadienyl dehydratase [Vulcanimicrobium alpinum]|uniref:Cyclohexadienyl dehydratase n=1 Tax=Vulcanimicrobium alpinum TaxID=3016050 RepID=A0AAN1XWL8_UNVUL|nr:transporter substrate-binding domain-containing protein [Vulcanimicrobium alpinum]BDE06740.1 cyclohexadienyl dehydratase [Vulcanimicrobium alpinum]
MRRLGFLSGVAAALAVPPLLAAADGANGTLRVGLTGDYKPYSYLAPDGTWSGLDVDIARMLAKERGAELAIVKTSWPSMTADLVRDAFDLAMGGVSRDDRRALAGLLSAPYMVDGKVALVRAADRARYRSLDDLDVPPTRVAVNPGGTNETFVRTHFTRARIDVVPTNLSIPGLVADGKDDVMITDGVEASLAANADARLAVLDPVHPYTRIEKVYFISKAEPELLAFVNERIARWERDGTFAALRTRWVGSNANNPSQRSAASS